MNKINNKKPLISYIIPCYNQSRWLYDAVSSAILSYSGPKELIIINDSSNEPGWNVRLQELQRIFPQLIILNHNTNKGLSASRNSGLQICSGDFIQFLDSDDLLVPNKIDRQLEHFKLANDISVSVTDYLLCDETLSFFHEDECCSGSFSYDVNDFLYKWERGLSIPIHCALFKQQILKEKKFNETLHGKEDWVFWCELAFHNTKISYLNIVGAIYRQHQKSMTKESKFIMGDNWKKATTIINNMVKDKEPNFYQESVAWYYKYYTENS